MSSLPLQEGDKPTPPLPLQEAHALFPAQGDPSQSVPLTTGWGEDLANTPALGGDKAYVSSRVLRGEKRKSLS